VLPSATALVTVPVASGNAVFQAWKISTIFYGTSTRLSTHLKAKPPARSLLLL